MSRAGLPLKRLVFFFTGENSAVSRPLYITLYGFFLYSVETNLSCIFLLSSLWNTMMSDSLCTHCDALFKYLFIGMVKTGLVISGALDNIRHRETGILK